MWPKMLAPHMSSMNVVQSCVLACMTFCEGGNLLKKSWKIQQIHHWNKWQNFLDIEDKFHRRNFVAKHFALGSHWQFGRRQMGIGCWRHFGWSGSIGGPRFRYGSTRLTFFSHKKCFLFELFGLKHLAPFQTVCAEGLELNKKIYSPFVWLPFSLFSM